MSDLVKAIRVAEDWAGTMPAKDAVKVRPSDWHAVTKLGREAAARIEALEAENARLKSALHNFMDAVDLRDLAMEDGGNVHGAIANFVAAEDEALSALAGKKPT